MIPEKSDVFVIIAAYNYKTVIVGKTNFVGVPSPTVGRGVEIGRVGYGVLDGGLTRASPQLGKSVAAARSTGLRPLHFSNPESLSGLLILQVSRYNYKIVIISKINFSSEPENVFPFCLPLTWEK